MAASQVDIIYYAIVIYIYLTPEDALNVEIRQHLYA